MDKKIRNISLVIIDVILINLAFYLAFYLRFDGDIPSIHIHKYINNFIILSFIKVIVFHHFKLYKRFWEYADIEELSQILLAIFVSNISVIVYFSIKGDHLLKSIYFLVILIDILFIGASRISFKIYRRLKNNNFRIKSNVKKVMIIGAGDAGARLIKDLKNNTGLRYIPVVIIDDDVKKEGQRINGIPVLGQRLDIVSISRKKNIDEIIIAIPSAGKKNIRGIIEECKRTKCKLKILPKMSEYIHGKVSINDIRDVRIEDLLGRDEVKLNVEEISEYIRGKSILVTGGGSIGSELCRQIAEFKPKELSILDIYENNVYNLQIELKRKYKEMKIRVIIASITDKKRMFEVMNNLKPNVVFHTAAHKHVPLMESNVKEAIQNNVLGTINVVEATHKFGVKKFVMISTDKAVNPTNIMGTTKRLCEIYIQAIDKISETEFVAVRFGNVLGSNGSVIPLFKRQIIEGGPVTVTHKEMIRYFMTIPEAVQLVIQAGSMALGGEIFVLDMGEPVKILSLAEDLIKLSGFKPYEDMPIIITGLRPGEKLYEELLLDEEGIESTRHEKIFIGKPLFIDYEILIKEIEELKETLSNGNEEDIINNLKKLVPTYRKNVY